jgi:IS605 OrfB family transposase
MKLVAAIKLQPSSDQECLLKATLERCNEACTSLAAQGFEADTFRQFELQKLVYVRVRSEFGLTAQAAIRSIAKVADAFKVSRERAPVFRPLAAQPYDDRIMRFVDSGNAVSLWTIGGRIIVPVIMGDHQRALMAYRKGEADLCFVRGKWLLACTCDIPETEAFSTEDWLGCDLGVVNILTDSDGRCYSGAAVEKVRSHLARRRAGLQRKGTKAAKRRLKILSGKQRRFQVHTNHEISKALVTTAERTGRGIALEDLKGILDRVTAKRSQRARLRNWSFNDLRVKIAYKAERAGVPILCVDPRYTSIGCSDCGLIDKRNRPDQATFSCIECGHTELADFNAAKNIRVRAARGTVIAPVSSPSSRHLT